MEVSQALWLSAGRVEGFLAAAALWAVSNACLGATPAAYAADVMPQDISGLALGIYRCAGDIGTACPCFSHNPMPCNALWLCDAFTVKMLRIRCIQIWASLLVHNVYGSIFCASSKWY